MSIYLCMCEQVQTIYLFHVNSNTMTYLEMKELYVKLKYLFTQKNIAFIKHIYVLALCQPGLICLTSRHSVTFKAFPDS